MESLTINVSHPVKYLQGREILEDRGINLRIIFFTSCWSLFQHAFMNTCKVL